MAETQEDGELSLIPYNSQHGQIVLRHGNSVVTLDPRSKQLTLRGAQVKAADYDGCPLCRRPFENDQNSYQPHRDSKRSSSTERSFVNPNYFRLLADKSRPSTSPKANTSPDRHLRALDSAETRNVSVSDASPTSEYGDAAPRSASYEQSIRGSSFLPGYFAQFFVERRVLGRGGRGVVMLVEHILDGVNLGQFACKRIPVGNDHDWLAKVLVEVQLLQRLNHPNLVSYRHVWLEDAQTAKFGPRVPCAFILQQFCNSGDLHDYVQQAARGQSNASAKQRKGPNAGIVLRSSSPSYMALEEIFSFFRDITAGLDHLHASGYIHRDLKPQNCLLHVDGQRMTVLVSDFGEVQTATAQRASTGATGTLSYCAPEVLRPNAATGIYGNFSKASDVFSLGMILYYMCFGRLPYVNADIKEENEDLDLLRAEISAWPGLDDKTKMRTDLPEKLYRYMKRLLSIDPLLRPTTAEILQSMQSGSDLHDLTYTKTSHRNSTSRVSPIANDRSPPSPRHDGSVHVGARPLGQPRRQSSNDKQEVGTAIQNNLILQTGRVTSRPAGELIEPESDSEVLVTHESRVSEMPHDPADGDTLSIEHRRRSENKHDIPSTRLLLDAPPNRYVFTSFKTAPFSLSTRTLLFLVKAISLTYFCAPYAVHLWLSAILLCLAALDLVFQMPRTVSCMLTGLQVVVWAVASGQDRLCSSRSEMSRV